jgi:type I restriction enzyme S subunit
MTPEEWVEKPLGDICSFEYGKSLPTSSRRTGSIPVYGSNGVVGYHDHFAVRGPGIIVGRKGSVGEVAWSAADFWPIDTTYWLRPISHCELQWLYWAALGLDLRALKSSTGVPGLNREDAYRLCVTVPPCEEQRKIAAILSSVVDAIDATQAVIDQLGVVKKAMMAELLTRGLPGRHTKFKQTEIGEVPQEWRVVTVGELGLPDQAVAQTGPFGAQLRPEDYVDAGVPVLRIGNVRWGELDLHGLDYVSPQKAQELARFRVKSGDLLFARQGATTGRNALADERCDGWLINYHIIRVSVDRSKCLPYYLMSCFGGDLVQSQVGRDKSRGNRDGINTANIMSFAMPLPPLAEQEAISQALGNIDGSIRSNKETSEGLKRLKSALMSVLLTGELRVKPDEDAP